MAFAALWPSLRPFPLWRLEAALAPDLCAQVRS
jgi:hypothetical protein